MSFIGIDLGTTHSLISVYKEGGHQLIPNAFNEYLTPSIVGVDDDGTVLVGKTAGERLVSHPALTINAFKRRMGTNHSIKLGRQSFRADELSALVIKSLLEDAQRFLGEKVTEAVISVPAYFNDAQRQATKAAAQIAGIKVERLINEPTAAALAYGLHDRAEECHFLVLDLGGGTFDVSVLELFDGVMEVHATAGDNYLGGEDFTEVLVAKALQEFSLEARNIPLQPLAVLRKKCNTLKHQLSTNDSATLDFIYQKQTYQWSVSREDFAKMTAELLTRLRFPIERALKDSSISPAELDDIVLVGGATRMPVFHAMITRIFGRFPSCTIDPDKVVAIGASIQAALKSNDKALEDLVLTDVCPYTLGTDVCIDVGEDDYESGHYFPIIPRNSKVPVSRVKTLYTMYDNQIKMNIGIYQGESRLVKNNVKLGELSIDLPKDKAGEQSVDVRFTYDVNGILEVLVTTNANGEEKSFVIHNGDNVLEEQEIQQCLAKLASLKQHPYEQAENRFILARAERLYEACLGEQRNYIGEMIVSFERILKTQGPDEIKRAQKQVTEILDSMDTEIL